MANPTVTHTRVSGAAANPSVLVDGPAWDATHTVIGLENVPNVDTTNASNISSGTLPAARLPGLVVQTITSSGAATIANNADVVQVNQASGAPITLTMPLASAFSSRTGGCLVSDYKGDAGTNNITVVLSGSDKFPGALTSWKISGDTGSIRLSPVTGGYVL